MILRSNRGQVSMARGRTDLVGLGETSRDSHVASRPSANLYTYPRPSINKCTGFAANLICGSAKTITISVKSQNAESNSLLFILLIEIIERCMNRSIRSMILRLHACGKEFPIFFLFWARIEALMLLEVRGQAVEVPTLVP
jgi:hypothetical protein